MIWWQIVGLVWVAGIAVAWGLTYWAATTDPTAHGQGIIFQLGCAGGLFWPFVLAYFLFFALPWAGLIWLFGKPGDEMENE